MPTNGKGGGAAIYFQQASPSAMKDELALVHAATVREECLRQLSIIIRATNLQQRANDESCILETFILFNSLRNATYDLCDTIECWQRAFTKIASPQLFGSDYIAGMAEKQNFLNGSKLKKMYNFNIGKGNLLLLPIPTTGHGANSQEKILDHKCIPGVNPHLWQQMLIFSNPPVDRTVRFYRMLSTYLSPKGFANILPLQHFNNNPWSPLYSLESSISPVVPVRPHSKPSSLVLPTLTKTVKVNQQEPTKKITKIGSSTKEAVSVSAQTSLSLQHPPPTILSFDRDSSKSAPSLPSLRSTVSPSRRISAANGLPSTQSRKDSVTKKMESIGVDNNNQEKGAEEDVVDDEYIMLMQQMFLSKPGDKTAKNAIKYNSK